jgi:hypothetical protein
VGFFLWGLSEMNENNNNQNDQPTKEQQPSDETQAELREISEEELKKIDEWMADSVASVFESNSNAKMLVVVGNNHILKKLEWQYHVVNKHRSI